MIDYDRLRRQIEETLADQDYYGHPSISPKPGPGAREALVEAIMSHVEECETRS